MAERLQKILSAAGIASRRTAETLIAQGRVTVNGRTVTEPGTKASLEHDDIRVDDRRVKGVQRRRYILLYKPRGYITTRSDPERRPTVIDLLAKGGVREYVYPVGRLDYDSEGLLVLTSDGELAALLTHPRHGIEREYEVRVRGVPDQHDLDRLSRGISLEGRRTAPAVVELTKVIEAENGQQALLSFVIREGRNRQVRNMCDAIGHPVVRLRRKRIGPITDEHIRPGEFRDLTPREVAMLRKPGASDSRSHGDLSGVPSGFSRKKSPRASEAKRWANASSRASAASEPPKRSGAKGPPRATARGGPGDEVPRHRTTIEARPRTGSGAKSRRPPAGGRPRRG
jgi:23S rRNA pseudouridine2605 synthase